MSKAALYRVEYAPPRVTEIYLLLFGSLVRKVSQESTLVMVLLMSNLSRRVNYILEKRVAFDSAFLLCFASCIFYKILILPSFSFVVKPLYETRSCKPLFLMKLDRPLFTILMKKVLLFGVRWRVRAAKPILSSLAAA